MKANTGLLESDGRTQLIGTVEKLERWRKYFDQVSNVPTKVVESVLDEMPEVDP